MCRIEQQAVGLHLNGQALATFQETGGSLHIILTGQHRLLRRQNTHAIGHLLKHVMDDRRGTVVEKVAAAEAAADAEEDL